MFLLIFNQLLKMIFIMLIAVICFKIKLITQEGNRNLSNLLLMVINPCVILTVYQTDYEPRLVKGLLISFAAAFAAHFIGIMIARLFIPSKNNENYAIERFASVYSNCGFIGIPLINSVLGAEGVFYLTAYMTVFNLLAWTHGLTLLSKRFELKKIKEGLLSPMIISSFIAMILFFAQIRIPSVILDSMDYIADMNTPVAMLVAGFSLAQTDIRKILTNLRIYWISFIKLLAVPMVVLLFLWIFHVDYTIAYMTLIAAACPTSATTTMLCIRYHHNYQYASELFSFTTILSLITIPIVTAAASFLFA